MNPIFKNIILICLIFASNLSFGQTPVDTYNKEAISKKTFDADQWEKIVGGLDYSEIQKKKKEAKKAKERERRDRSDYDNNFLNFNSEAWSFLGKFVLVVLAVILFAILIMHLFGNNLLSSPKNSKILTKDGKIDIERIEENMHEIELKDPIQIAINQGHYDMAIRLYYISIIKELSLKKMIKWKKDKTNRDYYLELDGQHIQPSFSEMTKIYERVWFGNKELIRSDFNSLESKFQQSISNIQQSTHSLKAANG